LLPYAVLGQTEDRESILQQVSARINELPRTQQSNLIAVTSVLAGLKLDRAVIQRLMRSELMQESVIYQDILAQGEQLGIQRGRVEGRTDEARSMVTRLLTKRFGNIPVELQTQVNALSVDRIESLGEDLLDFTNISDLQAWFNAR
jgi:predicted transposase YdaD